MIDFTSYVVFLGIDALHCQFDGNKFYIKGEIGVKKSSDN